MRSMARGVRWLGLLLLACAGAATAGEKPLGDAENPRNVRFEGRILPYATQFPRSADPDDAPSSRRSAVWFVPQVAVAEKLGEAPVADVRDLEWRFDGRVRLPQWRLRRIGLPSGLTFDVAVMFGMPWTREEARHHVVASTPDDRCDVATDAFRVLLLVERASLRAGDERFGSFVRRFRKSLDDLNALLATSVHGSAPRGIEDRFRLDAVLVYDRPGSKPPPEFLSHPGFDVAIACDEGGPLAGFSLPESSIGHNFSGSPPHAGLWSSWGEQALWHELLHFRGVQDFYLYEAADGALPGRWKGKLPLPHRYAIDLMASPYQPPALGEYAAVMANVRRGVARVGACEDTANKFGTMWSWIPARIDLELTKAGAPLAAARVRWWRSLARPGLPSEAPEGVAADRVPDGETTTDDAGKAVLAGDLLGRAHPPAERGRWLLVEVEAGGERRFEIVYGLDLNLAYAKGDKYGTPIRWSFDDLLRLDGTLPAAR